MATVRGAVVVEDGEEDLRGAWHDILRARRLHGGGQGPSDGMADLKRWTIASTSATLRRRLNLRCDGRRNHAVIEGSKTAGAAYYPKPMCRRIVKAMLEHTSWAEVADYVEGMCVSEQAWGGEQVRKEPMVKQEPTEEDITDLTEEERKS